MSCPHWPQEAATLIIIFVDWGVGVGVGKLCDSAQSWQFRDMPGVLVSFLDALTKTPDEVT